MYMHIKISALVYICNAFKADSLYEHMYKPYKICNVRRRTTYKYVRMYISNCVQIHRHKVGTKVRNNLQLDIYMYTL